MGIAARPSCAAKWYSCSSVSLSNQKSEWIAKTPPSAREMGFEPRPVAEFVPQSISCKQSKWRDYASWLIRNEFIAFQSDGTVTIESRWELIRSAFARPIGDSRELERAILSYNSKYSKDWKFRALHKLFEEVISSRQEPLARNEVLNGTLFHSSVAP